MSVEITLLISLFSASFAFLSGVVTLHRNARKDHKEDAGQIAMIMEKLANISLGIAELKENLVQLSNEQGDIKVRLAGLEASVRQAHKRIDEMKKDG